MVNTQNQMPTVNITSLKRTLNLLTISFILCYASLGATLFASTQESIPLFVSATLSLFLTYYVLLGIQASRLEKSVITWVGISILTSPFGPVIFYVWAWKDTKAMSRLSGYTKAVVNRVGEEGDTAFKSNVPKTKNPYRSPNAESENSALAGFWDRGYAVAERRQRAQT